jgi:tRNA threonylcarbamoyladenosine biosynthesis protein TsaE
MNIEVNNITELSDAAHALLNFIGDERTVIFEGEMGAGKTTFIKAICAAMGLKDNVTSPTFSIVNEYAAPAGIIYHFDFYRIKNLQEAYDIGYEEYFYSGNYCFIEWPGLVAELLPAKYVKVSIAALSADKRTFSFSKI